MNRTHKFSQRQVVYDLLKKERDRINALDDHYRAMETLKVPFSPANFELQMDCHITLPMGLTDEESEKLQPLIVCNVSRCTAASMACGSVSSLADSCIKPTWVVCLKALWSIKADAQATECDDSESRRELSKLLSYLNSLKQVSFCL